MIDATVLKFIEEPRFPLHCNCCHLLHIIKVVKINLSLKNLSIGGGQ